MASVPSYSNPENTRNLHRGDGGGGGGGGGGGIDCRRHVSSGVSRERGRVREGVSPHKGGLGASPGEFLKLDCLRMHFNAIFKSFSLILQAVFLFCQF